MTNKRISFGVASETAVQLRILLVGQLRELASKIQCTYYGDPHEYDIEEYNKLRGIFYRLHGQPKYAPPVELHIEINKENQAKEEADPDYQFEFRDLTR